MNSNDLFEKALKELRDKAASGVLNLITPAAASVPLPDGTPAPQEPQQQMPTPFGAPAAQRPKQITKANRYDLLLGD